MRFEPRYFKYWSPTYTTALPCRWKYSFKALLCIKEETVIYSKIFLFQPISSKTPFSQSPISSKSMQIHILCMLSCLGMNIRNAPRRGFGYKKRPAVDCVSNPFAAVCAFASALSAFKEFYPHPHPRFERSAHAFDVYCEQQWTRGTVCSQQYCSRFVCAPKRDPICFRGVGSSKWVMLVDLDLMRFAVGGTHDPMRPKSIDWG